MNDPRLVILEEGLLSTLHTLAASSHLAPRPSMPDDADCARRDHFALLDALRARGLTAAARDDHEALERHVQFRVATEQYVRAYAANAGYDVDAVHASYSRWERDTALIGHAETVETPDEPAPDAATDVDTRSHVCRPGVVRPEGLEPPASWSATTRSIR